MNTTLASTSSAKACLKLPRGSQKQASSLPPAQTALVLSAVKPQDGVNIERGKVAPPTLVEQRVATTKRVRPQQRRKCLVVYVFVLNHYCQITIIHKAPSDASARLTRQANLASQCAGSEC
jgi:hypothetical protein